MYICWDSQRILFGRYRIKEASKQTVTTTFDIIAPCLFSYNLRPGGECNFLRCYRTFIDSNNNNMPPPPATLFWGPELCTHYNRDRKCKSNHSSSSYSYTIRSYGSFADRFSWVSSCPECLNVVQEPRYLRWSQARYLLFFILTK